MTRFNELRKLVSDFRDRRDWGKYHTPRNLSESIAIESAELLELFQWGSDYGDIEDEELKDEMADILIYLLSLADAADIDLGEAVKKKVRKNKERYPVEEEMME